MTILIANIGTSDLSLKIHQPLKQLKLETLISDEDLEQDYFLPIGFDRNEPNLKEAESELSVAKLLVWQSRQKLIKEHYNQVWNVSSFRELTKCLLDKYKESPQEWHDCIRPGRLWGVVQEAMQHSVQNVYIFVTNQYEDENVAGEKNRGAESDTIYLFKILQNWFKIEFKEQLKLHKIEIPKAISPIDQDGLLAEYYNKLKFISSSETILISVKGGTPQMQTALRVQAISSEIANQIYLEPQLSIKKLLLGEASDCNQVSYWRYQRVQKYQTVKKLLNRWDFDGAREILAAWLETLKQLHFEGIVEVEKSLELVESAVQGLQMAIGYFNLDTQYAQQQVSSSKSSELSVLSDHYPQRKGESKKRFSKLLNLYTQCCLLWQTDRLADFLTRMGSFYEETLHELILVLDGTQYFDKPEEKGNWFLKTETLLKLNQPIAQRFYELEKESENWILIKALQQDNCLQGEDWVNPLNHHKHRDRFVLPGRSTKLNFVRALVGIQGNTHQKSALNSMAKAMQSLDYWCVKRNKLVHGAQGISKQRMIDVLKEDKQLIFKYREKQRMIEESRKNKRIILNNRNKGEDWIDLEIENSIDSASLPDSSRKVGSTILEAMATICQCTIALMQVEAPPSIFPDYSTESYLDSFAEPYYLYSDLRRWVLQVLDSDE